MITEAKTPTRMRELQHNSDQNVNLQLEEQMIDEYPLEHPTKSENSPSFDPITETFSSARSRSSTNTPEVETSISVSPYLSPLRPVSYSPDDSDPTASPRPIYAVPDIEEDSKGERKQKQSQGFFAKLRNLWHRNDKQSAGKLQHLQKELVRRDNTPEKDFFLNKYCVGPAVRCASRNMFLKILLYFTIFAFASSFFVLPVVFSELRKDQSKEWLQTQVLQPKMEQIKRNWNLKGIFKRQKPEGKVTEEMFKSLVQNFTELYEQVRKMNETKDEEITLSETEKQQVSEIAKEVHAQLAVASEGEKKVNLAALTWHAFVESHSKLYEEGKEEKEKTQTSSNANVHQQSNEADEEITFISRKNNNENRFIPDIVLSPSPLSIGGCLALSGQRSGLTVSLSQPSHVQSVAIGHIIPQTASDVSSAPANFTATCLCHESTRGLGSCGVGEDRGNIKEVMLQQQQKKSFGKRGITRVFEEEIIRGIYDARKGGFQTFTSEAASKLKCDSVRFRFLSNHGHPNYTCIYRVHVYQPDANKAQ
ncbi:putative SUN domain-containing protein 1/2 [Monocercomonoides exilis]|uniref:putative SUN domain-containing protein 1/2 n=1 Tax=Monocercomonoides exilis TaxID=2049356 RepID=UPI00355A6A9E|nr:putative SUN domain-containing protein 1/2 [Monocercomonoides exilis]